MRAMRDEFHRYVWLGSGYVIGSFVVVLIITGVLSANIHSRVKAITDARDTLYQHNHLIETMASFKQIGPQVDDYEAQLQVLIPSRDELINFGGWINTLAAQYQLTARISFIGDPPQSPGDGSLGRAEIALQTSGRPDQLKRFFDAVELQSPKFLTKFQGFDLVNGSDEYTINAQGVAFFH